MTTSIGSTQHPAAVPPSAPDTSPDGHGLRHVAVILDGNRRWARARGLPVIDGYRHGGRRVLELLAWCRAAEGIEAVTLWPLSTENLHRDRNELDGLLHVITDTTQEIAGTGVWRLRIIGAPDRLPARTADALRASAGRTRDVRGPEVNIAVAYGGRDEITRAIRNLLAAHRSAGTLHRLAGGIESQEFGRHLDTAGQPDPDLVIRTSGEQRLSGFMPWQTAYSEFYFCPVPWPDFDQDCFDAAMAWYAGRTRRTGR
ncbi:polyprenyl diphosphate synthase [Streptomyces sp. KS 21]|uniref:polyprenyl diphosphate synthase n=1 Tax=Streptomyces sp. KS 21 TaxID=2485150 RepID=UPI0010631405|nr:polyprenyl diphosphate synthase [Streptomyces sp. KS 21]TDU73514.1 short-chain Z-isoprenyl diphosphate synthase [Streptomyces sp. KS 21]